MPPPFLFDGLDKVEDTLREAATGGDASYVRLLHIQGDNTAPQIGRKAWAASDLASYLGDDDDDEPTYMLGDEDNADPRLLAAAMCRWIKEAVALHFQSSPPSETEWACKVDLRSPKGATCLAAPRFRVRRARQVDAAANLAPTIALEPAPPATMPAGVSATTPGQEAAWHALGAAWQSAITGFSRQMGLMQAGYTHMMRLSLAVGQDTRNAAEASSNALLEQIRRQAGQIEQRDKIIARLTDEMLAFRVDLLGLGLEHGDQAAAQAERYKMVERGFSTLQEVGKLYMAGRLEIEPELVDVLTIVRANPKLLACLRDKKVQRALQDPDVQATIIDALITVAASVPDDVPPSPSTPPQE